jgi:hypothetical protein
LHRILFNLKIRRTFNNGQYRASGKDTLLKPPLSPFEAQPGNSTEELKGEMLETPRWKMTERKSPSESRNADISLQKRDFQRCTSDADTASSHLESGLSGTCDCPRLTKKTFPWLAFGNRCGILLRQFFSAYRLARPRAFCNP